MRDDPKVDLQRWLKAHADESDELRLSRAEVKQLHDEMARLQQSADRLRKQNRKVRRRLERAGIEPDADDAES